MSGTLDSVAGRLLGEVPDLLSQHGIPGVAVGVCQRSGASWSAGFGVLARGSAEPVTVETMFSVQSVSKVYTATAVMLAVQAGLLDLDVPVTAYLPEFTVNSRLEASPERRMTLRHLLSHTAGFTHEAPLGSNFDSRDSSFEEHCRSISDTWLRFPVGHHFEYSNLGIDLAAYIVQRVSGLDFSAYVRSVLLGPLGLHRTTFDQQTIAREVDRAVGHYPAVEHVPVRVPMIGAGGAYVSVADAVRFVRFQLGDGSGVLGRELLDELGRIPNPLPGQRSGYGLGVAVSRWNGRRVLHHSGGGYGFLSDVAWDPEAGFGVVVLTNSEGHPLQVELASGILRDLTGSLPSEPEPPAVDHYPNDPPSLPDDAEVRTYVIDYLGLPATTLRMRRAGGEATLEAEGYLTFSPQRLTEYAEGLYFCPKGEALDLRTDRPTYGNVPLRPTLTSAGKVGQA